MGMQGKLIGLIGVFAVVSFHGPLFSPSEGPWAIPKTPDELPQSHFLRPSNTKKSTRSAGGTSGSETSENGIAHVRHLNSNLEASFNVKEKESHKTCLDPAGPTPVILLTLGRSGSQSTWQIMGNLTGMETLAHEYTGSKVVGAQNFIEKKKDDPDWIVKHMCQKQSKFPEEPEGIVGFNWKAYPHFFEGGESAFAIPGLQRIAELADSAVPIRVVRSRRNLLDVYRSIVKHQTWEKEHKRLPPHCYDGSKQCVKLHRQAAKDLTLDASTIYETLIEKTKHEDEIDQLLERLHVPTVHVQYDRLYYPATDEEGSAEWNKIFAFLGKRANHTWDEIEDVMEFIPSTFSRSHRDTISNFDEVATALKGTQFFNLLRFDNQ